MDCHHLCSAKSWTEPVLVTFCCGFNERSRRLNSQSLACIPWACPPALRLLPTTTTTGVHIVLAAQHHASSQPPLQSIFAGSPPRAAAARHHKGLARLRIKHSTLSPWLVPCALQEANFYWCVAYGKPIGADYPDLIKGPNGEAGGAVTGCPSFASRKKRLSTEAHNYATEIAWDELGHVRALRGALRASVVAQPAIDIGAAFRAAAKAAAGGATLKPTFDPYTNDLFFYHAAFIFEDVGVTAYAVSD
jgi:hypothetical protein